MEYRKIPRNELEHILEQHKLWVESSGNKGKRAKLSGVDLTGIDLCIAELTGADLSAANLCKIDLTGAELGGADFSRSFLGGSILKRAVLRRAIFNKADLRSTDLSNADLRNANLTQANISGAILSGANISGAILNNAFLSYSNLIKTNFVGTILCETDLSGANLSKADLSKADLSKATLFDARLYFTNLSYIDLSGANITGIKFWDIQRSYWKIDGIICEYAFWDEKGKERIDYKPGVFEKLYKEYPKINLRYKSDEYTLTQHNLLPFIIAKLNEEYPSSEIVIKKTEEAPDGCSATVEIRGKVTESETEEIKNKTENYKNKAIQSEKKLLDQKVNLNLSKLLGINEQIVNDLGFGNIMINPTINIYSQDIYGNTQQITQSGNIQVTINQLREAIEKDLKESKNKNIHPESKSLFRKITGILKGAAEDEVKEQLRTLVKEYGKKAFEEIVRVALNPATLNMLYQFIR